MAIIPAKTAYSAEELQLAFQNGGIVEKITLEINDSVDLCFKGAPTNWTSLHPAWFSYDSDIASVDSYGVVTAKGAGRTLILMSLDNGMYGTVTVEIYDDTANDFVTDEIKKSNSMIIEQKSVNEVIVYIPDLPSTETISLEDFMVIGDYSSSHCTFFNEWTVSDIKYNPEGKNFILSGNNRFLSGYPYTINFFQKGTLVAKATFVATSEIKKTEPTINITLDNQEAIYIPADSILADGKPIENILDVAKYAFSYATDTGEQVIPTYETDAYGLTEIIDVTYSTIKGRNMIIIKDVTFKVYLDANQDGKVSTEEKTTEAIGYYNIKVEVDRTLTVEDWSIVR